MKISLSWFFLVIFLCFFHINAQANDDLRHYNIGDFEITAITDAKTTMEKTLLPEIDKYPEFEGVFNNGPAPALAQTFYFKDGSHQILIDAGWGTEQKIKGATVSQLADLDIKPAEINDILLTHLDQDHIGGLIKDGKAVFPNATLWISEPEFQAWSTGNVPGRQDSSIKLAQTVLSVYRDRIHTFKFGEEILPGIKSVDATGHTPGHTAFDIQSGNDKMTIAGDILHIAQVQLQKPELSTVYDGNPQQAAASRKSLLERAAQEKSLFAGMHFPMISDVRQIPGGGFVMKQAR